MTGRLLNAGIGFYVVQKGDTLSQISERYKVSVQKLSAMNNIVNVNFIKVGRLLILEEKQWSGF